MSETKTPWTTNGRWIFGADGKIIGVIPGDGKAKAALVVTAINHYEEMVALLERIDHAGPGDIALAASIVRDARALLTRIHRNRDRTDV